MRASVGLFEIYNISSSFMFAFGSSDQRDEPTLPMRLLPNNQQQSDRQRRSGLRSSLRNDPIRVIQIELICSAGAVHSYYVVREGLGVLRCGT